MPDVPYGNQTTWIRPRSDSEWLVSNGLGGFASGALVNGNTRRYHGLLTAALPPPAGRFIVLDDVRESFCSPEAEVWTATDFRLEQGMPIWGFGQAGFRIERIVFMPYEQNTVCLRYLRSAGSGSLTFEIRPFIQFRPYHADPADFHGPYRLQGGQDQWEITGPWDGLTLRVKLWGGDAVLVGQAREESRDFPEEAARGFGRDGRLWSPGAFRVTLGEGESFALTASMEPWSQMLRQAPKEALDEERARRGRLVAADQDAVERRLRLAADQFIIHPPGRTEPTTQAGTSETVTVIAGYPWFTDWGRDTMISLEGLTLATGRSREAERILRAFARYWQDGLIPNYFPNGASRAVYHAADASLWYFHALDRYLAVTSDRQLLQDLLPGLQDALDRQHQGTLYHIQADPQDGLLRQGESGLALTWMDARVRGRAVTARMGKAVEINALWYNALRLLESWLREEAGEAAARPWAERADRVRDAFNRRFWFSDGGYLYDVVDGPGGDDASCRPNQLLAIALRYPVLDPGRWQPVLATVEARLLTPFGLRTLAPGHPDYRPACRGDASSRDAAYHQGTVWAWLIGPFIDAWLKLHPAAGTQARKYLEGFVRHLDEAGVGSISEIFDAEAPFRPAGCPAQAWSVAEVLRCWQKTAEGSG